MRLTCPNCGAQYEVARDAVPAEGRDVQCSNCGVTWLAKPEADPKPAPAAAAGPRSTITPEIAEILRAEAAREAAARRAGGAQDTKAPATEEVAEESEEEQAAAELFGEEGKEDDTEIAFAENRGADEAAKLGAEKLPESEVWEDEDEPDFDWNAFAATLKQDAEAEPAEPAPKTAEPASEDKAEAEPEDGNGPSPEPEPVEPASAEPVETALEYDEADLTGELEPDAPELTETEAEDAQAAGEEDEAEPEPEPVSATEAVAWPEPEAMPTPVDRPIVAMDDDTAAEPFDKAPGDDPRAEADAPMTPTAAPELDIPQPPADGMDEGTEQVATETPSDRATDDGHADDDSDWDDDLGDSLGVDPEDDGEDMAQESVPWLTDRVAEPSEEDEPFEAEPEDLDEVDGEDDRFEPEPELATVPPEPHDAARARAATAAASTGAVTRRDLLPDIEEINSSLRHATPRPATTGGEVTHSQHGRGFRLGFGIALLLAAAAALIYSHAGRLGAALPPLEPVLSAYAASVDGLRLQLDSWMRDLLEALG